MSAENVAFVTLAVLSIFLVVIPLPSHWRARNYGVLLLIFWISLSCLVKLSNTIVWLRLGEVERPTGWCVLSSKLLIGAEAGIPGAMLCVARRILEIGYAESSDNAEMRVSVSFTDWLVAANAHFECLAPASEHYRTSCWIWSAHLAPTRR